MPTRVHNLRICPFQLRLHSVDAHLHVGAVDYSEASMLFRHLFFIMVVNERFGRIRVSMMDHRVHQRAHATPRTPGRAHDGHAQHLMKTGCVDFHAPLLHHVHHVERHDDWFSHFQQLKRQVEIALESRRVDHVHHHVGFS